MIGAGGEIHIVMTGPAGDAGGPGEIRICLRRSRVLRVTDLAAPHVGRVHDGRIVVDASVIADDLVWRAGTTLGRSSPMWILWIMTGKLTVFPVSGSEVCGVWHRTHISTPRREPPWAES